MLFVDENAKALAKNSRLCLSIFPLQQLYPEMTGVMTMWTLGASGHALEAITGRVWPHGTVLGCIPPALAFTTVKGFSMAWPWNANITPFEKKLNGLE